MISQGVMEHLAWISSIPQSSVQAYSRLRNPLRLGTMAGKRNCASDTFGSILGMGRAEGKAYGASGDAITDLLLRCNYFGQHVNLMGIYIIFIKIIAFSYSFDQI